MALRTRGFYPRSSRTAAGSRDGHTVHEPHRGGPSRAITCAMVRFEFPIHGGAPPRRASGGAPDREPVLLESWRSVIAKTWRTIAIGHRGQSRWGGAPSRGMVADDARVAGLICLGYPFSSARAIRPGRVPGIWKKLRTPTLILQGNSRLVSDGPDENRKLQACRETFVSNGLEDGDHSFKPRASSGRSEAQNIGDATRDDARFHRGSVHDGCRHDLSSATTNPLLPRHLFLMRDGAMEQSGGGRGHSRFAGDRRVRLSFFGRRAMDRCASERIDDSRRDGTCRYAPHQTPEKCSPRSTRCIAASH